MFRSKSIFCESIGEVDGVAGNYCCQISSDLDSVDSILLSCSKQKEEENVYNMFGNLAQLQPSCLQTTSSQIPIPTVSF